MTRAGVAALDKARVKQGLDPTQPWGGRSPRVLTRAYIRFTLGRQTTTLDESRRLQAFINNRRRRHYGSYVR